MRIIPIALGAVLLALPLQLDIVVRQSTALAKSIQPPGFGDHPRPWAEDMLKPSPGEAAKPDAPKSGAVSTVAAATPAGNGGSASVLCGAGDEAWQERLSQLKAAEVRVGAQVTKLAALKVGIEELLKQQEKAEEGDIQRLVNLYRNMKPAEAAVILADLDMPIVVSIVMSMSERDAAPILAQMPKATAQQVTREIARQRSLDRLHKDLS